MKKLFPIVVLSSLCLALLSSCAERPSSHAITSLDDFLSVAPASSLKISTTSFKNIVGSSGIVSASSSSAASASSAASSSSSETSSSVSHSAGIYANGDFTISNDTANFIGIGRTYSGITQYLLLNVTKKTGFITADGSLLNDTRKLAQDLVAQDYGDLVAAYDLYKSYVGKSASDYEDMTKLYLAYSIAGTTAGYTLLTTYVKDNVTTEINYYLTLDQVDKVWSFTNFSKRTTVTTSDSTGLSYHYALNEYAINVVGDYPALNTSVSGFSVYLKDDSAASIKLTDGIPLTPRT